MLRLINQKAEPEASRHITNALFFSANDQVLTDVLGDQVNGVTLVQKILQSPLVDPDQKHSLVEATKKVLVDLKVTSSQAYRRLLEEVGLPVPSFGGGGGFERGNKKTMGGPAPINHNQHQQHHNQQNPNYPAEPPSLAAMMAALQMQSVGLPLNAPVQGQSLHLAPSNYQQGLNGFASGLNGLQTPQSSVGSNNSDSLHNFFPSNRDAMGRGGNMNGGGMHMQNGGGGQHQQAIGTAPGANRPGIGMMGMGNLNGGGQQQQQQAQFGGHPSSPHPQYPQYVYQMFQQQQQQPNMGTFHA